MHINKQRTHIPQTHTHSGDPYETSVPSLTFRHAQSRQKNRCNPVPSPLTVPTIANMNMNNNVATITTINVNNNIATITTIASSQQSRVERMGGKIGEKKPVIANIISNAVFCLGNPKL